MSKSKAAQALSPAPSPRGSRSAIADWDVFLAIGVRVHVPQASLIRYGDGAVVMHDSAGDAVFDAAPGAVACVVRSYEAGNGQAAGETSTEGDAR